MKKALACSLALLTWLVASSVRAAEPTYDIPVILATTGSGSSLGAEEQQALQIVETVVNRDGGIHGRKVRFVFLDDQSTPQLAVQLANQALDKHPAVLIGSSLVASCNAMAPLMKDGPVMYCLSSGIHPPAGGYVFTNNTSTLDLADALLRYFRLEGWTSLALMTSSDATGQDADHGFAELLARPENKDIKLVEHVHFNDTDLSVAAQIERIKSAAPQALILWTTGTPVATILRDAAQAGLDVPMGTTPGNMTYAEMDQLAALLPHELYFPCSEFLVGADSRLGLDPRVVAKQKEFYDALAQAGMKPDQPALSGWDPAMILIDLLRELPDGADAKQVRDHLIHLEGHAGVAGLYDFEAVPQRGLSIDNTIVTRWNPKAGRWEVVSMPTGVPMDH
jgi:branched-chain amino acid transport system substrate-binding protein